MADPPMLVLARLRLRGLGVSPPHHHQSFLLPKLSVHRFHDQLRHCQGLLVARDQHRRPSVTHTILRRISWPPKHLSLRQSTVERIAHHFSCPSMVRQGRHLSHQRRLTLFDAVFVCCCFSDQTKFQHFSTFERSPLERCFDGIFLLLIDFRHFLRSTKPGGFLGKDHRLHRWRGKRPT